MSKTNDWLRGAVQRAKIKMEGLDSAPSVLNQLDRTNNESVGPSQNNLSLPSLLHLR